MEILCLTRWIGCSENYSDAWLDLFIQVQSVNKKVSLFYLKLLKTCDLEFADKIFLKTWNLQQIQNNVSSIWMLSHSE